MIGNEVLLAMDPKGKFMEGIIDGALLPGIHVQIKPGVEPVGGRYTFQPYDRSASGKPAPVYILLPAFEKTVNDAYVSGSRGFIYSPIKGEEMNIRAAAAGTGTGDSVAIGDQFMIEDATGLAIADAGPPDRFPWEAIETIADLAAGPTGTMVAMQYTGE